MKKYKENDIFIGKTKNKYQLQKQIAVTGNAQIWKCIIQEPSNEDNISLVIKLLKKEGRSALKADHIEHKLKHLECENIMKPFDIGIDGDIFFIVMEFCSNSLFKVIQQYRSQFSTCQILDIMGHIFNGLSALHSNSLVHLDIKPSNILKSDSTGQFMLADFDTMRDLEKTVTRDALKEENPFSPQYAAPEQWEEHYYGNRKSDIYSAGVTLYEALAGEAIPHAGSIKTDMYILREMIVTDRLKSRDVDDRIVSIVSSCLRTDKENRPTALELYGETKLLYEKMCMDSPSLPPPESFNRKWLILGALIAMLAGVTYFFLPESKEELSDCQGYNTLYKRDYFDGVEVVRKQTANGKRYALKEKNAAYPYSCELLEVKKPNSKGYALLIQADSSLIIVDKKGNFLEIDKAIYNDIKIRDYYEQNIDFR